METRWESSPRRGNLDLLSLLLSLLRVERWSGSLYPYALNNAAQCTKLLEWRASLEANSCRRWAKERLAIFSLGRLVATAPTEDWRADTGAAAAAAEFSKLTPDSAVISPPAPAAPAPPPLSTAATLTAAAMRVTSISPWHISNTS